MLIPQGGNINNDVNLKKNKKTIGNSKKKKARIISNENHITSYKDERDVKYCINCNLQLP